MVKTTVYLVRHAEAMGNVLEVFQGHTDCEVSDKGRKQLDCLAERFKDVQFDAIYSSPLKRTVETAKAVNRYHSHEIILNRKLIEINGGAWENQKWADIPKLFPEEYDLWTSKMHEFSIKGGESMTEVYERMKNAVTEIIRQNIGKTIVIVSHGCAIRNYLCYAGGENIDCLEKVGWADNTAVSLVEYDESLNPTIIYKNNADHLSNDLSTLAHSAWCRYEDGNFAMNGAYYKENSQ